jgi:Cytochrome c
MNRLLKFVLYLLGGVALLIVIALLYVNFKKPSIHENKAEDITVEFDSSMILEGQRMARILCINCHGGEDGSLSGAQVEGVDVFGKIFAPNITHHENSKLEGYTDGELKYLFRTGIKQDGYYSPPWMPKFPGMSERDINCIIAFLRSDDQMLTPSEVIQPDPEPSFLAKMLTIVAFKPLPYPEEDIAEPDVSNPVEWGEYLSTAKFECYSCHSADFATNDLMNPSKSVGFFGGGNRFTDREGKELLSKNITMDKEAGLGSWTEAEFIKTVRFGERKSGIATRYPMEPFSDMTNSEVSAIWSYLQTIPHISEPVAKP